MSNFNNKRKLRNHARATAVLRGMIMSSALLLATATVNFHGYVPPHAANDGLRYRVVASSGADVPAALRACGIDDYVAGGSTSTTDYKFAVTRAAEGNAQCLRMRLPAGSRVSPLDHWTTDAQAD